MNAIVYTSNTGSTERYASFLAEQTGLPACSLQDAEKAVPAGVGIIYPGWIMAGAVKAEDLSAVLDWYRTGGIQA